MLIAHGLPPYAAGSAVSLGWLGLAVGAPIMAWLAQRFNQDKVMIMLGLAMQCLCVSLLLVMKANSAWLSGPLMFFWGAGTGANLLPFVLAARCAGTDRTGTAMALVNCGQFIAGGILVYVPGRLLDVAPEIGISGALAILPISLLATLVLCFRLKVIECRI